MVGADGSVPLAEKNAKDKPPDQWEPRAGASRKSENVPAPSVATSGPNLRPAKGVPAIPVFFHSTANPANFVLSIYRCKTWQTVWKRQVVETRYCAGLLAKLKFLAKYLPTYLSKGLQMLR